MLADAMMPEAFEHGGKLVGIITVMGFLVAAILSAMESLKPIQQTDASTINDVSDIQNRS